MIHTLTNDYSDDDWNPLRPQDRARVQMVYVPAARDGARHVISFLRGRLWGASRWTDELDRPT